MKQRSATKDDVTIGSRIRMRRLEQKVSQADLGEAIGVSFQQIQKYENGINRVGAVRLKQIAHVLGTTTPALMDGTELEQANPDALPMMASFEGAKLARAFNEITDPNHRRAIVSLATTLAETAAANYAQAAE